MDLASPVGLAEPARDVILGQLVLRVGEELARRAILHEITGAIFAHVEERREVGDARSLLHVVGQR